jgi:hypothetical protein
MKEVTIIINEIVVNSLNTYNDAYMEKVMKIFEDTKTAPKWKWLVEQGIKVKQVHATDNTNGLTVTRFYVEVTEQQATEYYLRF